MIPFDLFVIFSISPSKGGLDQENTHVERESAHMQKVLPNMYKEGNIPRNQTFDL